MVEQSRSLAWRPVDIAVASVIGVASSLVYWLAIFLPWDALQAIIPGFAGVINGLWLFAGPLAIVIVRKPGAALYAEIVAAILESFLGNAWGGVATVLIALMQGIGAELAFALFAYKVWNIAVTGLSGVLSGVGCYLYTFIHKFAAISWSGSYGAVYFVTTVISGFVVAGIAVYILYYLIAQTGVLDRFESGRVARGVNH